MLMQSMHAAGLSGGFEWRDHGALHAFFTKTSRAVRGNFGPSSFILEITHEDIKTLRTALDADQMPVLKTTPLIPLKTQARIARFERSRDRKMCRWAQSTLGRGGIVIYVARWGEG